MEWESLIDSGLLLLDGGAGIRLENRLSEPVIAL